MVPNYGSILLSGIPQIFIKKKQQQQQKPKHLLNTEKFQTGKNEV